MTRAIGILELTSIAGDGAGRRHAEKRERTAPALQNPLPREIPADARRRRRRRRAAGNRRRHRARWGDAGGQPVLANIHPSVLPAISGLNVVGQRQAAGIVETRSVAACISAADHAVKAANVTWCGSIWRLVSAANATWWWRVISPMSTTPSRWPATAQARKDYWFTGQ